MHTLLATPAEDISLQGRSIRLRLRRGPPNGPPLLLLHGHPQTHVMWHRVWPELARRFTLVAPDLRGYGDSTKPAPAPGHAAHSKREMAAHFAALMQQLGHDRFAVLAHDRGARVAHRLALDHGPRIKAMTLLDIAPTLAMYEQAHEAFARAYWHWFFLIQPAPLPETLLGGHGAFYVRQVLGGRHAGLAPFPPEILREYERCAADPATVQGFCEDYRAAASIDLEHDRADRSAGRLLTMPLQVLWGAQGVVERCFDVLAEWRRVATGLRGQALPCGHYIAEEAPEALLAQALPFLQEHGA